MRYGVYGVTLATEYPLAVPLPPSTGPVDVTFELRTDPPEGDDPTMGEPVYTEGRRPDGRAAFVYWRTGDRDVVRITDAMDFHCWPDRIVCHLVEQDQRFLVEIALFGMILSLWLERRGTPTLHASAAVVGGRAVAFLASGRSGKTSTAAACVAAGHPFLSDDLIALEECDARMFARPGYPQFRMWPEQARHFVGSEEPYPIIRPDREKRRIDVGDGFGTVALEPVELRRLYLPFRTGDPDAAVTITPVRPGEAMLAVVQHSFLPREVVRLGLQGARLPFLARLIAAVPVRRLAIPEGLDQLPRAVAAIERDLGT